MVASWLLHSDRSRLIVGITSLLLLYVTLVVKDAFLMGKNNTDHSVIILNVNDATKMPEPTPKNESPKLPSFQLPILVMGMPKTGTTSIQRFFQCNRTDVSHWMCSVKDRNELTMCGKIIQSNIEQGLPPFHTMNHAVYAQMDYVDYDGSCYFPQVEALEELHKYYPNATMILNTRNITKWVASVRNYHQMGQRFVSCNMTGLPSGVGDRDKELIEFVERHYENIRRFVRRHPSHRLVEIDIESDESADIMTKTFHVPAHCWGHANARNVSSNRYYKKYL
jgi:hypothetical protein